MMKQILSAVSAVLIAGLFTTCRTNVTVSQSGNLDYEDSRDTTACDTLLGRHYVATGDDESDSRFAVLGESSALLYKDKKFMYTSPEGSEYVFTVNPDGVSVTLGKGQANNVEVLTIPAGVNGLGSYFFVTAIGDSAFYTSPLYEITESENLRPMAGVKKLIISEGIEYVGVGSFENAEDLEEVIIPSTLVTPATCIFLNCAKLKSITISK